MLLSVKDWAAGIFFKKSSPFSEIILRIIFPLRYYSQICIFGGIRLNIIGQTVTMFLNAKTIG